MMHLLEEHDSVSSAVDYLRSVPRLGRNNLILADAQGHLAVFEIGHRRYGLFETQDGVLVNTNHFVSPELQDCFVDTNPPRTKAGARQVGLMMSEQESNSPTCLAPTTHLSRPNTFHRYEKVTRELNAALGQIDVPFAQRLMASHDTPICRHAVAGKDSATNSTSIFLPARRTMLFCHGLPCQGQYDEFVL
jgi:hypothetical protein